MTDIYVQPGAQKYLKFGKAKLVALRALRKDMRLPSLKKSYVPEAGFRVDIGTTDDHEYVRCWGGGLWPVGLSLPDPNQGYITRETLTFVELEFASGPLPNQGRIVFTHKIELVVGYDGSHNGGTAIETYTGTRDIISSFSVGGTHQSITYSSYPGPHVTETARNVILGEVANGVITTDNIFGTTDGVTMSAIPHFGEAATAFGFRTIVEILQDPRLPDTWKETIISNDPLDADTPFTRVILMPFEPVKAGVAQGMFNGVPSGTIDEIQVYGAATYRYNHVTDVWTFVNWTPASATAPYVRLPMPAGAWPDRNFVANYGEPQKGDIRLAAAERQHFHDPDYQPVMAAVLRAAHQL